MNELKEGKDIFTLKEIFEKAAKYKGLGLEKCFFERHITYFYGPLGYSSPIKEYTLTEVLLEALKEEGIEGGTHPHSKKVFILRDKHFCDKSETQNGWHFLQSENEDGSDFRVCLRIKIAVKFMRRGFYFFPHLDENGSCPEELRSHHRMLKVLVRNDKEAPEIAREIVKKYDDGDGEDIFIPWSQFGLCGIRCLGNLFTEFAGRGSNLEALAEREKGRIFNRDPCDRGCNRVFVAEHAHPMLFENWRDQYEVFVRYLTPHGPQIDL